MCQTFRRSVLIFVPLILRWKIYYIRKERCNSISPPKAKRKYLDHINTNTHSHTHTHTSAHALRNYIIWGRNAHISIQAGIVYDYLHISFWGRESFRRMLLSLFLFKLLDWSFASAQTTPCIYEKWKVRHFAKCLTRRHFVSFFSPISLLENREIRNV